MSDPSGENDGSVSTPGVAVRRRAEPPFRPTTHRSPAYSKATRSLLTAGWRRRRVLCAETALAAPMSAAASANEVLESMVTVLRNDCFNRRGRRDAEECHESSASSASSAVTQESLRRLADIRIVVALDVGQREA